MYNETRPGRYYLLPSTPPKTTIKLPPRRNFFAECLNRNLLKKDKELLFYYSEWARKVDPTPFVVTPRFEAALLRLVDQAVKHSWGIRKNEEGWSQGAEYTELPLYQKIWLDEARSGERTDQNLEKVVSAFTVWFGKTSSLAGAPFAEATLKAIKDQVFTPHQDAFF